METHQTILELKHRVNRSVVGQEAVVERLVIGLLADGNVLIEGLPGLAKTRAIKSLARSLQSQFSRIQFTPDLLPSDVTGTEVYHDEGGKGVFTFQPGPIFGNLVLADEINRAPAKVQAALLEAMEERQVTVAGKTYPMPELFMVLATQNPVEQEGTYPLPEAQMDRFLMHVTIDYPETGAEAQILHLVRGEEGNARASGPEEAAIPQETVLEARKAIRQVTTADTVVDYIVALVTGTRYPEKYGDNLKQWIHVGASPRGTIALDRVSRAHAWLNGQAYVTPDNVRAVVHDCLRHRIMLSYEANADGVAADDVIRELVGRVAVA